MMRAGNDYLTMMAKPFTYQCRRCGHPTAANDGVAVGAAIYYCASCIPIERGNTEEKSR